MRRVPAFLLTMALSIALIAGPGVRAAARPGAASDAEFAAASEAQVAPATLSAPAHIVTGSFYGVAEVVDSSNHVLIAATGKGGVWYITNRGGSWASHRILKNPADGGWDTPLIAIDGQDRIYIAASKWQGPEVPSRLGTFYVTDKGRTRGTFPSTATRLSPAGKGGTSLKVGKGHIYLSMQWDLCCVSPDWPAVWFRTNASGDWVNTKVGNGWSPSMRLATNGHARIVYAGQYGLRYAVAATTSGDFSTTKIPKTTADDYEPILALDTQGYSAVTWTHSTSTAWTQRYSMRKSGSWSSPVNVAASSNWFDATSFDMDTLGRPHVVVANSDDQMLRDVRLAGGAWTTSTIAGPVAVNAVSVRRAQSGVVVVAWATNSGIYVSKG